MKRKEWSPITSSDAVVLQKYTSKRRRDLALLLKLKTGLERESLGPIGAIPRVEGSVAGFERIF